MVLPTSSGGEKKMKRDTGGPSSMETMREREVCVVVCASGRDLRTWESLAPPQAKVESFPRFTMCLQPYPLHYSTYSSAWVFPYQLPPNPPSEWTRMQEVADPNTRGTLGSLVRLISL